MKIYLRNSWNFSEKALDFYHKHFELTRPEEAEVIVINDFEPIKTDKIVACNSTGIDHIKAKEVISLRGEDLSDLTAVPELCLGMAIYCTRIFKAEEIKDKTLGIIGYGRIGKEFGHMASRMGMRVDWYDDEEGADDSTLKFILRKSDIVSLNITADKRNEGFFNQDKFKEMKDGAIFLNSARPWLVNEKDFYWALEHKLAGAWVDFNMPFAENLVTTPHLGGTTRESKLKTEMMIAKKLLNLYGRK